MATGTGPVPLVTLRRQARNLATHRYAIQTKSPKALTHADGAQGSEMDQLDLYNEPPAAPNPTVDLSSSTAIFANMDNLTVYHVPVQPAQPAQEAGVQASAAAGTATTSASAAAPTQLTTTSKTNPDGPDGPDGLDGANVNVFERLHEYASVRNSKLEEARAAQRNKLDPECTFTPALSTNDNTGTPPELLATPSTVAASLGFSMLEQGAAAAGHGTALANPSHKPAGSDRAARSAEAVARHVERVRQGGQGQSQGQGQGHELADAGTRVGKTGGEGKAAASSAGDGAGASAGASAGDVGDNELEVLYHPELKHPVRHIKLPRSNKVKTNYLKSKVVGAAGVSPTGASLPLLTTPES